jgi:hypothetical protein
MLKTFNKIIFMSRRKKVGGSRYRGFFELAADDRGGHGSRGWEAGNVRGGQDT